MRASRWVAQYWRHQVKASFSHLVTANFTLSWSEVMSTSSQYYSTAKIQVYSFEGSPLNKGGSSNLTFFAANTLADAPVPPAVATAATY